MINSKITQGSGKAPIGILSLSTIIVMIITTIVSLRALTAEAEYGLSSAFYYLFGAIVFLIPTALVSAELTAMFPNSEGGVFTWIGHGLGKRFRSEERRVGKEC